jgi:hypothetical protein
MHHFIILLSLTALLAPAATMSCESAGDPAAIASVLHENALLVTGTANEVFRGRAAQLALWQEDFAAAERAVYLRTPALAWLFTPGVCVSCRGWPPKGSELPET